MSATNSTTNYALPIFIGTDKPAWLVDWNSAMTAIDAAIKGVDTDVQGVVVDISGLSSTVASHTSSIATISGQITVITTNLNTATGNINTINSLIGNGTPTTTDQTIIGAINELHANQGDLADLTTPAASLVAAINAISAGGAVAASAVSFDNTGTSLSATNVQAAIVELSQGGSGSVDADDVSYNNAASGLTATNVQDAIDELSSNAGYKVVASVTDTTKTIAQSFVTMKAAWDNLSRDEKAASVLIVEGYSLPSINISSARFGGVVGTSAGPDHIFANLDQPNPLFGIYNSSGTFTDRSTNLITTSVELLVL